MCLGVPGKIIKIEGENALVDFWGTRRWVRLDTIDKEVVAGDYVLTHVGFAIRRIPEGEIDSTLTMYDNLMKEADLMGLDIRSEIEANLEEG